MSKELIEKLREDGKFLGGNFGKLMHEAADALEAKAAPVGELRQAFEAIWPFRVDLYGGAYISQRTADGWQGFQAGAAYQRQIGVVMPESVGVLILGGMFHGGSGPELGDIDIEPDMRVIERIQMELVTSSDDVHLELFARLNGKEVGRG